MSRVMNYFNKHIIITGAAGFIGSSLVEFLLKNGGYKITCIDNFDDYYDISAKQKNIAAFENHANIRFLKIDIRNADELNKNLCDDYDIIVHLAAKAGVRQSILQPNLYEQTNVAGTLNLLEFAKQKNVKQFVFASSSSIYGVNPDVPWRETSALMPVSPYAATKIAGEYLGYTYSKLYDIRFIALRFFTVYGAKQRPDLAIHKFTELITKNNPITLYGNGDTFRDYTYIDDILSGIAAAINYDKTMFETINLGNNHTVGLLDLVATLENVIGKKAIAQFDKLHPADSPRTFADITKAKKLLNYNPQTQLNDGIRKFYEWYVNN
ncbi:MAG: GDP-mannose 4,6-dehydratase [Prevotellaceae bacterium]|nr:GDP-mannose 4,6-dehydratase [Prevotellaceae bacterium]